MFYIRLVWVCFLLCKEETSSPVSSIIERRDMGVYEVPLYVFVGFWDGLSCVLRV